jgi:hypothetical protein
MGVQVRMAYAAVRLTSIFHIANSEAKAKWIISERECGANLNAQSGIVDLAPFLRDTRGGVFGP